MIVLRKQCILFLKLHEMTIIYNKVESSAIKQIAYDTSTSILVTVFHTGSMWAYIDVPIEVYDELIHAPSIGNYFNLHIRNFYASQKYAPSNATTDREKVDVETK